MKGLFRENMLLEVFIKSKNAYYKSIVQEVNEEDLAIGIPMKKRDLAILPEGESLVFRLNARDALYYFKSKVIGTKKSGQVLLYLISLPEEVQRQQRRQFFRFFCMLDVHYWLLPEDSGPEGEPATKGSLAGDTGNIKKSNAEKAQRQAGGDMQQLLLEKAKNMGEPEKAETVNISGGGLLLATDRRLSPGDRLLMKLFLGSGRGNKEYRNNKEIMVKGEVSRAASFNIGELKRYRSGVKFLEIDEKTRDEIIGFIFAGSRERIR